MEASNFEDIKTASNIVLDMGVKNLAVTMGGKGVLVKNRKLEKHIEAEKVNVLNNVGQAIFLPVPLLIIYISVVILSNLPYMQTGQLQSQ